MKRRRRRGLSETTGLNHRALVELLKSYDYAASTGRDIWDFAVEMQCLENLGMAVSDFRWLVCMGYTKHAREVTRPEDDGRQFVPMGNLSFSKRTCFVLTECGAAFARGEGFRDLPLSVARAGSPRTDDRPPPDARPRWNRDRHELRVAGKLVKQFKWPAINQEMILAAFEEEAWPSRIDDPLPPQPEQDSKRRLHDTIKCLNKNQVHELLHFRGDGTGEGIVWERCDSPRRTP